MSPPESLRIPKATSLPIRNNWFGQRTLKSAITSVASLHEKPARTLCAHVSPKAALRRHACPGRCVCLDVPKSTSTAYARIRAEVIRLVGLIPEGKFTTYGSIAVHMNVVPRHVASVLARLSEEEAASLPWHRVVAANARLSTGMDSDLRREQQRRLEAEGMSVDATGHIQDSEAHFHVVGLRRDIRWSAS